MYWLLTCTGFSQPEFTRRVVDKLIVSRNSIFKKKLRTVKAREAFAAYFVTSQSDQAAKLEIIITGESSVLQYSSEQQHTAH